MYDKIHYNKKIKKIKKKKYLDITKYVQDLYVENYKILTNEIKEVG